MREITLALHDVVYEKLEHFAQARGLTTEEAGRFLVGDLLAFTPVKPPPELKDPMDVLYEMMASMGFSKCDECSKKLTAKEIKVNSTKCFTCKPDISDMEF